jgi:hypothetical protein
MSIEMITKNYKGKWRYQGDAVLGCDELELTLDSNYLLLIKKSQQREVDRIQRNFGGHFFGNYLLFNSSPPICISYADEKIIVFGEQRASVVADLKWEVEARRIG